MRANNKSVWGIIFIAAGLIFAGNVLDFWAFSPFFDGWWTLFIIVPCVISIVKRGFRTAPFVGLIIGSLLFLSSRGYGMGGLFRLLLPAALIFLGISYLRRGSRSPDAEHIQHLNGARTTPAPDYTAVFGGNDIQFPAEEFWGANLNAVFGSVRLDLRDAWIGDDIVINVSSIFGGVEILLPDNVQVHVSSVPIFGGVSTKFVSNPAGPIVYVNATCLFGGVEIS